MTKTLWCILLFWFLSIVIAACKGDEPISMSPSLRFVDLSPEQIQSYEDTLTLWLEYEDLEED